MTPPGPVPDELSAELSGGELYAVMPAAALSVGMWLITVVALALFILTSIAFCITSLVGFSLDVSWRSIAVMLGLFVRAARQCGCQQDEDHDAGGQQDSLFSRHRIPSGHFIV